MDENVTRLESRLAQRGMHAREERKVLPMRNWRPASIDSRAMPASHFGCVEWYMYEHSDAESKALAEPERHTER